jgi:glucan biosynthesis protein C
MHSPDRMHALDAVRAFALLLGVALHATQPFVAGLPWMTRESPSDAMAAVFFTIHMFRMPVFFLIAGFFGRMLLERRGSGDFIRDRSKRILVPLVFGLPIVMLVTGLAYIGGALATGVDLQSVRAIEPPPMPGAAQRSVLASINLVHLWFLYYLLIFYAAALLLRVLPEGRLQAVMDASVRFATSGLLGPVILALPIAAYYYQTPNWSSWSGLPAPFSLVPNAGALISYGLFFTFGWLLHRQQQLLSSLERRWRLYCAAALAMWVVCRTIGGSSPHWGPYLKDGELLAYTVSYMIGAWCWSFGLIGAAMRFLSGFSPVRRYLADASYWIYLMHIAALLFFQQILHPFPWHWSVKYLLTIAGAMPILLSSYHGFVRFTFLGALLNGRRAQRAPS